MLITFFLKNNFKQGKAIWLSGIHDGATTDGQIWHSCRLRQKLDSDLWPPEGTLPVEVDGTKVPHYIVGDIAFKRHRTMMKGICEFILRGSFICCCIDDTAMCIVHRLWSRDPRSRRASLQSRAFECENAHRNILGTSH